jgi:hypothetical protein
MISPGPGECVIHNQWQRKRGWQDDAADFRYAGIDDDIVPGPMNLAISKDEDVK